MKNYYPSLPKEIDLFALCVNDTFGGDGDCDMVNKGHAYIVKKFVKEIGFAPYGVRLIDYLGSELTQTFYMQRFVFIEHCLN